jgi:hypothetical protein
VDKALSKLSLKYLAVFPIHLYIEAIIKTNTVIKEALFMPSLAHKTERVMSILRELPPAKVNEVINFAEYLKIKTHKVKSHTQNTAELPLYHLGVVDQKAFERSSLYGDRLDALSV